MTSIKRKDSENNLNDTSFAELTGPVFIGSMTSKYLFDRACKALNESYRSKSYMEKYGYEP